MKESQALIWDETFPSLLLKGKGTTAFLHGQTTADVFAKKELDTIFMSCWLSTKGSLKALLEIRLSDDMAEIVIICGEINSISCLLYTSPSPRDLSTSRMPSSA